jgi:hypothetical protein
MAFDRESEVGALWSRSGRSGEFLSGKITVDGQEIEVVVFPNTHKKPGERSPDWRMYKSESRDGQAPAPQAARAPQPRRAPQPVDLDDEIPF